MTTNVLLRDLDLGFVGAEADGRRLEIVVDGLSLFSGAQLAVDTTLVCALRRDGRPTTRAAVEDGARVTRVRKRKEATYYSARNQFERFRGFWNQLADSLEFCRPGNYYFLKDSNFWCVHVNVPWPVCAHAIPFRMLWLPRFMMTHFYISMKPLWKVVENVR